MNNNFSSDEDFFSEENKKRKTRDRAYFAQAARKTRAKQKQEVNHLLERNNTLQKEQPLLAAKIAHLKSMLDFLKEQQKTQSLAVIVGPTLREENDYLKEQLRKQRWISSEIKKLSMALQQGCMGVDYSLVIRDKSKELFSKVMSLCYSSAHCRDWVSLGGSDNDVIQEGVLKGTKITFKYLPCEDEFIHRLDLINIPIPYETGLKMMSIQQDLELRQEFLRYMKKEDPNDPKYQAEFISLSNEKQSRFSLMDYRYTDESSGQLRKFLLLTGFYDAKVDDSFFESSKESHSDSLIQVEACAGFPNGELSFEGPCNNYAVILRRGENNSTCLTYFRECGEVNEFDRFTEQHLRSPPINPEMLKQGCVRETTDATVKLLEFYSAL